MTYAKITAIGTYVPAKTLTNDDLSAMVETNDEWIVKRTGIRERRISAPEEFTTDLCEAAVRNMAERYGSSLEDIDMIIACTHTPDFPFPTVSALLQDRLSVHSAGAVDLNATCAGFVYGLHMAGGLIASGLHRKVLVVAGDTMSKITDYTDRASCILFGDGAGAALVEADARENGILGHYVDSDGSGGIHVYRAGLSKTLNGTPLQDHGYFVQNGREVYKWAVGTVPAGMRRVAESAGVALDRVDWFVPHSANMRMIESICEKSGFPLDKTLHTAAEYGNTSAASIPLSLDKGVRAGLVKKGDLVMLYGFGGGLVQAGQLIRWTAQEA